MDFRSLMPFGRTAGVARAGAPETDPFTGLRREMNRLFEDFARDWAVPARFGSSDFLSPKINVAETETGLELTAELPGIEPKDIQIDLADGILTLKAESKAERDEKDDGKKYHLVERSYGTFLRRMALPFEADQDRIEASFDKGVLKIVVPRSPAAKSPTRRIEIKSA